MSSSYEWLYVRFFFLSSFFGHEVSILFLGWSWIPLFPFFPGAFSLFSYSFLFSGSTTCTRKARRSTIFCMRDEQRSIHSLERNQSGRLTTLSSVMPRRPDRQLNPHNHPPKQIHTHFNNVVDHPHKSCLFFIQYFHLSDFGIKFLFLIPSFRRGKLFRGWLVLS